MEDALRDADDGVNDNEPDPDADDADQDAESQSSHVSDSAGGATQPNQDVEMTSPGAANIASPLSAYHPPVRAECLTATTFDIVPTTAAPHSTSINAVTATADMRWVFSGGSDGYVRKFNWVDSINSKLMLTVAQRHPFVDSVVKAGVLMTYWENMDGNTISPVYSLASHKSGSIRLQSVRHDEGKEIALLQQHTSAVSVLTLTSDEKSLLSGSWDKRLFDWDLNTGQTRRAFGSTAGQISAIEMRPESSLPVPKDAIEPPQTNGTYSSNYQAAGDEDSFRFMDTSNDQGENGAGPDPQAGSPADSLFGGADSLFGDGDGPSGEDAGASGNAFGIDEDDEFGKALTNGVLPDADAPGEPETSHNGAAEAAPAPAPAPAPTDPIAMDQGPDTAAAAQPNGAPPPQVNGLPHAEELEPATQNTVFGEPAQPAQTSSTDNTFLGASIDGTIRIWDRRQPDPVARIIPRSAPPWCMNACWSPDGNYIYVGRRNNTVEEYSLHKGLRDPERTFRFPQGSGPVTALRAMPNGRHIVCASHDILRLYDLKHEQVTRHSTVPFLIIPGHRTGTVSQLYIDQACRFMVSTSGNRGWEGNTTEVLLGYEIGVPR
ncbi:WD40 repeat domain-containing protein [Aspergillus homomorphus CBS 101889]|uniref:Putative transcription factor n=1 Tax=Aspergillus homomorphus (strain CBS 101889) TaxID=1450537 RepID=A0A395HXQ6_ASPHC|nr:putative transcription factor [Aspergillus homomorphus CBS 101889]RAL12712.1 putative transcription factor [Aspergillus homomorphus CBS 101889]